MTDIDQYDMPSAEDILQLTEEPERDPGEKTHDVMPVRVEGIVRTEQPGARTTGFRNFSCPTSPGVRILDDDPRRATATIIPLDNDIRLAGDVGSAESNAGTLLPAGVPLVLASSDEIWAAGDVTTALVSVFYELWAR